jgi:hypothetical protein
VEWTVTSIFCSSSCARSSSACSSAAVMVARTGAGGARG